MTEEYVTELKMTLSREGLGLFFQDWQVTVLKEVHERVEIGSRDAHYVVADERSRAATINFLNWMVDEGLLEKHGKLGKGGYREIYHPPEGADLDDLRLELISRIIKKMNTLKLDV